MATPSTVNAWLDDLAASLLKKNKSTPPKDHARLLRNFRRQVQRHSYGRTNQFDVEERLDGLEEKFQILDLDDLSDALHQRRTELQDHHHKWIPDILDFLLKLSGDPARNERLLDLYIIPPRLKTPPPLTWNDVLTEDPVDVHDQLWQIPSFTNDDYFHDESFASTKLSKPEITQNPQPELLPSGDVQDISTTFVPEKDLQIQLSKFEQSLVHRQTSPLQLTELQAASEVLLLLLGLPTTAFQIQDGRLRPCPALRIVGIDQKVSIRLLQRAVIIREHLDLIKAWMPTKGNQPFIEVMKQEFGKILQAYVAFVNIRRAELLGIKKLEILSLLEIIITLESNSTTLAVLSAYTKKTNSKDEIACLDALYDMLEDLSCHAPDDYAVLQNIFLLAFERYWEPIWEWLHHGSHEAHMPCFFIEKTSHLDSLHTFWKDQFALVSDGRNRPLSFLKPLLPQILVAGKTTALLSYFGTVNDLPDHYHQHHLFRNFIDLASESYLPFVATFRDRVSEHVSLVLAQRTIELKNLLLTTCGLSDTFDGFDYLYLGRNGAFLDSLDSKIFHRIDRCVDSWNDRYLVAELVEAACLEWSAPIDIDALSIASIFTSSRRMQSRRQSVKILGALSINVHLPWQLANIIPAQAMTSYRRIALILTQMRRAKCSLERTAYIAVTTIPLSEDATTLDQLRAQVLSSMLLQFVNTVYNHFTFTVAWPMTTAMRQDMASASSMDEMIEVHRDYIHYLEHACIATPKLKLLNTCLLNLLDLCIRFADLVSNSMGLSLGDHDTEAGSFTSARSQLRRRNADVADSGDELDDLNEGYSSFIVLDEDTTTVKEVDKLRDNFKRQLDLFIAGLRGTAKSSDTAEQFMVLAERLAWIIP